jgi:serine/threonine protein kinase
MTEEFDPVPRISKDADFQADALPILSTEADPLSSVRTQVEDSPIGESDTWRDPNWLSASFLSIEQAAHPIDHTGTIQFEGQPGEGFTMQEPVDHLGQTRLTDDESYKLIKTILHDSVADDDFTLVEGNEAAGGSSSPRATERPNVSRTIRLHNPLLSQGSNASSPAKAKEAPKFDSKNYKIIRSIGEGGSGVVFEALQLTLNRRVAVKVLKQRKQKTGSRSRVTTKEVEKRKSRFLHEVNITAKLQHPNIIPVFDLEIDKDGEVFYSMRLVDEKAGSEVQQSWAALLRARKGDFSNEVIERDVQIFDKVCDAIRFAHSENIIHRDLKPDNVMVGNFGEVLVIDWGMSLDLSEGPQYFSAGGTTTYMAPEMGQHYLKQTEVHLLTQELFVKLDESRRDDFIETALDHGNYFAAAGLLQDDSLSEEIHDLCRNLLELAQEEMALAKQINRLSDIYLLGAILYEIAVGHPPHYVPLSSCRNVEEKHHREFWLSSNHKIQRLVQIDDPLRLSLCNIALRALQKDPDDRFRTIDELKDALKEFANQVQSMRLVAKGRDELTKAQGSEGYMHLLPALESFRGAETLFSQGQDAKQLRLETACEYARRADRRKDYDAGLSILAEYATGAEHHHAEVAKMTDRLKVGKRRLARNRMLAGAGWVTAIVLPLVVWAVSWLNTAKLRDENSNLIASTSLMETKLARADVEIQEKQQQIEKQDQTLNEKVEELAKTDENLKASQLTLDQKLQELTQKEQQLTNVESELTDTSTKLNEKTEELSITQKQVKTVQSELEQLRFESARGQFSSYILPIPLDLRRGQVSVAKRRLELLRDSSLPAMLKNVWIARHFAKFVNVPGQQTRIDEEGSVFRLLPWTNGRLLSLIHI